MWKSEWRALWAVAILMVGLLTAGSASRTVAADRDPVAKVCDEVQTARRQVADLLHAGKATEAVKLLEPLSDKAADCWANNSDAFKRIGYWYKSDLALAYFKTRRPRS